VRIFGSVRCRLRERVGGFLRPGPGFEPDRTDRPGDVHGTTDLVARHGISVILGTAFARDKALFVVAPLDETYGERIILPFV